MLIRFHVVYVTDDGVEPEDRAERIARSLDAFSTRAPVNLCTEDHHCLTVECYSVEDADATERALHSHCDDCIYDRDGSEHVVGFSSY